MLGYGLAVVLHECIYNRNYFDLDTFHERVDGFDYGPAESGNKPPKSHLTIERIRNDNVNLSAAEALCLARYLGEMVGDLVPPDNMAWRYYLIMREILEIVTSPYFLKGTEDYLRVLIREHHELFVQLSGHLRPKHHFMVHFPDIMKRNGPFINYSALLLERKHREGKMYARASNSRRNLPFSVAVKIQLRFAHHLMSFNPTVTFKPVLKVRKVRISSLLNVNMFLEILPFPPNCVVSMTRAVDVLGTTYRINMVVIISSYDLFPVLGKIRHIILSNDGPMFVVQKLSSVCYRENICAFVVREVLDEYVYVSQKMFVSYLPLWQRTSQAGEQVVSLRHSL
ncbi:hypothetical protein FOCC_FOCC015014 [Frankliniella occidentalis]|nr:hypothetical protein FOCC_FOCC015014 [Frankliniella occidentalis]